MNAPTLILTSEQIRQKIRRIAFQVYENNVDETHLILAGISGEGYTLAQLLQTELQRIVPFEVTLLEVDLDKSQPAQPTVHCSLPPENYESNVVILIDDVLYTGRTLAFSMQPFLAVPLRKLQVAVLIDRNHPLYPVAADYKGYELSTTLSEHVEVKLTHDTQMGVYLR